MRDDDAPAWLPDLIPCDWNNYQATLALAYRIFRQDFADEENRPVFRGLRMGLKRHPELDGKSATFWHFVTEGRVEVDRTPVRERLERIAWPKAILVEANNEPSRVLMWSNERRRSSHTKSTRWVVALADFSYVVVVDEREGYVLPWTAYPVAEQHRRQKLKREHDGWKRAQKG